MGRAARTRCTPLQVPNARISRRRPSSAACLPVCHSVLQWELVEGPDLLDLLNEHGGRMRELAAAHYFAQLVRVQALGLRSRMPGWSSHAGSARGVPQPAAAHAPSAAHARPLSPPTWLAAAGAGRAVPAPARAVPPRPQAGERAGEGPAGLRLQRQQLPAGAPGRAAAVPISSRHPAACVTGQFHVPTTHQTTLILQVERSTGRLRIIDFGLSKRQASAVTLG